MKIKYRVVEYERKGKCNLEVCGGLCCKVLEKSDLENDIVVLNNACKHLTNGLCARHNINKPQVCNDFPVTPFHSVYQKVKHKCTYWFEKKIKFQEVDAVDEHLKEK